MPTFDPSKQVPRVATPKTVDEIIELFAAQSAPLEPYDDYLIALVMVETGRGAKLVANNFGNLAAGGYANGVDVAWTTGKYWRPEWYDSPPAAANSALHEKMLAGKAPSAFRAYEVALTGLDAFVALMHQSRYAPVLAAARADDPTRFALALASTGYSQDYTAAHGPTFRSLVDEIRRRRGVVVAPPVASSGSNYVVPVLLTLAALTAAVISVMMRRAHRNR